MQNYYGHCYTSSFVFLTSVTLILRTVKLVGHPVDYRACFFWLGAHYSLWLVQKDHWQQHYVTSRMFWQQLKIHPLNNVSAKYIFFKAEFIKVTRHSLSWKMEWADSATTLFNLQRRRRTTSYQRTPQSGCQCQRPDSCSWNIRNQWRWRCSSWCGKWYLPAADHCGRTQLDCRHCSAPPWASHTPPPTCS